MPPLLLQLFRSLLARKARRKLLKPPPKAQWPTLKLTPKPWATLLLKALTQLQMLPLKALLKLKPLLKAKPKLKQLLTKSRSSLEFAKGGAVRLRPFRLCYEYGPAVVAGQS